MANVAKQQWCPLWVLNSVTDVIQAAVYQNTSPLHTVLGLVVPIQVGCMIETFWQQPSQTTAHCGTLRACKQHAL